MSESDTAAQERLLGKHAPRGDDAVALRDARGLRFERLEWLGDSILDLLAVDHRTRAAALPDLHPCCAASLFETTDAALGRLAESSGITHIANWELSDHRAADLVEAVVGATFSQFGWGAARETAVLLHAGLGEMPAVRKGQRRRRRTICQLGAQVFDTSVTIDLFESETYADEHELSRLRGKAISNAVRAEIATTLKVRRERSRLREDAADDLDYMLGTRCLADGVELAVSAARTLAAAAKP